MKPILILCLGNEFLSDDSFGPRIAEIINGRFNLGNNVETIFSSHAGFNLLDLLNNRDSVLIVDTIITGTADPGTHHFFPAGHLAPSRNLTCSHQINLPTAIKLGRELGINMPKDISVLAIEALDIETLNENMTGPVKAAVDSAVIMIRDWAMSKLKESEQNGCRERKSPLT